MENAFSENWTIDSEGKHTFQCDSVFLYTVNGLIGDNSLAVLQDRCDADFLPLDGNLNAKTAATSDRVHSSLGALSTFAAV